MSKSQGEYGDRYDKGVAVAMVVLIVLSIVGVVTLQISAHKDCRHPEYTYCEPESTGHH
jgi:hypothetical protein